MSSQAQAAMSDAEYAIKFRRSSYTVLGWYYGSLYRMAKGVTPYDQALFLRDAEYFSVLSRLAKEGFITGSESGDTKARSEIWSKAEAFKLANDLLEVEAARLAELAKNADFTAIQTQFAKVQKTCKGCHDDFKKSTN